MQLEILLLVAYNEGLFIYQITDKSSLDERTVANILRDIGNGRPDKTNGKYLIFKESTPKGTKVYLTPKGKDLIQLIIH